MRLPSRASPKSCTPKSTIPCGVMGWRGGAENKKAGQEGARERRTRSTMHYFDDCDTVVAKEWILKGLIARGEASSWIAPPGKGKSALLAAIMIHGNPSPRLSGMVPATTPASVRTLAAIFRGSVSMSAGFISEGWLGLCDPTRPTRANYGLGKRDIGMGGPSIILRNEGL